MRHARPLAPLLAALLALAAGPARAAKAPPPPKPPAPPAAPAAVNAPAAAGDGEPLHRAGDWPAKPSGKRVTLEEGLTLDDALGRIADAAGWNLVARAGKLGDREVTVRLRAVPVEDALDAVLEGTPLVATRRGDLVTVAPGHGAPRPTLTGFTTPTGKRFTGDFKDTPAEQALRKVADAAGLSLVFPPGLRGTVNGHFKDAPVEDALRAVLAQAGLVAAREGQVLAVSRPGGASLVIEGGRRGFQVRVDGLEDLGDRINDEVQHNLQGEGDGESDGAPARDGRRGRKGQGVVLHGDQVLGAGDAAREVVVLGGSASLAAGASARQIVAVGGGVDLGPGAAVEEGVVALGGDIHVAPGARVGQDAVSVGGKIVIDPGGDVAGEHVSVAFPGLAGMLRVVGATTRTHDGPLWRIGVACFEFALFFLLGLLTLVVARNRTEGVAAALPVSPVKSVLVGILGWLAVLPVCILLVVTVVGIPFVPVVLGLCSLATILGFTGLSLFIGRRFPLPPRRWVAVAQLAIGTAILVLIGQIPFLGGLTWVAGGIWLLGVNLLTRFGKPPAPAAPPAYATVPPPPPPPASPPPEPPVA